MPAAKPRGYKGARKKSRKTEVQSKSKHTEDKENNCSWNKQLKITIQSPERNVKQSTAKVFRQEDLINKTGRSTLKEVEPNNANSPELRRGRKRTGVQISKVRCTDIKRPRHHHQPNGDGGLLKSIENNPHNGLRAQAHASIILGPSSSDDDTPCMWTQNEARESDSLPSPSGLSLNTKQTMFFHQVQQQYNKLLDKYIKLQDQKLVETEAVFESQRQRVASYTEAAKRLIDFHKEEADQVKALAEAADLMNLLEHNKKLEHENGTLRVQLEDEKSVSQQLEIQNHELRLICTELDKSLTAAVGARYEISQSPGFLSPSGKHTLAITNGEDSIEKANFQESHGTHAQEGGGRPIADDSQPLDSSKRKETVALKESLGGALSPDSYDRLEHKAKLPYGIGEEERSQTVTLGSEENGSRQQPKEVEVLDTNPPSQNSLMARDGFPGAMGEADLMADDSHDDGGFPESSCLEVWQNWVGRLPGVTSEIQCPATGSNTPSMIFTHQRTGFKFELGPVPKVEADEDDMLYLAPDENQDGYHEEFYFSCLSLGEVQDDLPPFIDGDEDGILFKAVDAPLYFKEIQRIICLQEDS